MHSPWIAIDLAADPVAQARLLRRAHEVVLGGYGTPPVLRELVVRSWERCLAAGVEPDHRQRASDPLGDGSDLLGGADRSIDYSVVSATAIWYVQVLALVAGHVAALVLAHDRALVVYGTARAATRSQIVMLVVMVAFTILGLWLLSEALNQ